MVAPTCRYLLLIAALLVGSSRSIAGRNVVLLISDNQNKSDCGCYGNPVVQTPNIDRLAREGVRFLDAFATTASCGPSRAVIYSGSHVCHEVTMYYPMRTNALKVNTVANFR